MSGVSEPDPAGSAFRHGVVHDAGEDLQAELRSDRKALALWERLTPLGRNEFICWVEDARQAATRRRRIVRTREELLEGKKRPCCWSGCIHRDDKAPSRWQQAALIRQEEQEMSLRCPNGIPEYRSARGALLESEVALRRRMKAVAVELPVF